MKIINEGHKYELADFEGPSSQQIQFIKKAQIEEGKPEVLQLAKRIMLKSIFTVCFS